jgi:hypothetical protein
VRLCIDPREDHKIYKGKDVVYGYNVRMTAVSVIYEAPVSIYFVPEGQISEPTVIVDQVMTKRNRIKREVS